MAKQIYSKKDNSKRTKLNALKYYYKKPFYHTFKKTLFLYNNNKN